MRRIFFFTIRKIYAVCAFLIYTHRTKNLKIDLNLYTTDSYILRYIFSIFDLSPDLSFYVLIECILLICIIITMIKIVNYFRIIGDKCASVYIGKDNSSPFLLSKLSRKQRYYFDLGVSMYKFTALLQSIMKLIFHYMILCQLDLELVEYFIKSERFFEIFNNLLINFLKIINFKSNDQEPFILIFNNIFYPILSTFSRIFKT